MKKFLSLVLMASMLLTSVALVACGGGGNIGADDAQINMDIDLNNKPALNILMPNTGKSIEDIRKDSTVQIIEKFSGYKANYTQLPADATTTLNTILTLRLHG